MNSSQSNNMFQQQQQQQRTGSRLVNELLGFNVISNKSEQQETRMSPLSSSSYTNDSTTNSTTTTTQSSMAKIIDIQRCRHQKETLRGEEPNEQHCWNSTSRNSNNQQDPSAGNRWIGARQSCQTAGSSSSQGLQNQELQSGEALSSFESDYDLLVYLGETETEDIVDTERSLDYQDQTWRQSICGGASLAPTIDESLSELINSPQPSRTDFDLLNTPTVSNCPPANPQTYSNSLRRPTRGPYYDQQTNRGNLLDDSLVFNGPTQRARKQQVNSGEQAKRTEEGATSGLAHCQEENQLVEQKQNIGNRLASLFNRKAISAQRRGELPDEDLNRAQVYGEKSRTLGAYEGNKKPLSVANMASSRRQFEDSSVSLASSQPKQQLSGVSQSSAAELDRLLAEMSESLDLDSLARFDPHSSTDLQTTSRREEPISERSQTLSKFQTDRRIVPISANNNRTARSVSTNKLVSDDNSVSIRSQPATKSRESQKAEQVSCESILDEYDGASRMLEQMISESLLENKTISKPTIRKTEDITEAKIRTINQSGGEVPVRDEVEVLRKMSTCSSSMATDTTSVLTAHRVSGNPQLESRSVWRHKRSRRRSKASDDNNTPEVRADSPPPPPEVDYTSGDSVICVEAELDSAEEPRSSQMDRMRRRTMTSMRSMRNKISDLIGHSEPRQRPAQPEPPKRSSSIGSRGSGRAQTPVGLKRVEGRESRSKKRERRTEQRVENPNDERARPNTSFGQQIRERLSRSKSRLSKFLGGSAKRAQSTPNTKQDEQQDDSKLFEPSDIARNCELPRRDSFDESLERHLAASLKEKKSSAEDSSLSGLDTTTTTRSRSKNRGSKKESRPSSLMSLKRFGSLRKQRDLNGEETSQDLDSMKVSSSSERKRRGNKKPEDGDSTTSALRAPTIVTTNEYFGQVAPARTDSPDKVADSLSLNVAEGAKEMKRPNRSQSMRSFGRQLLSPEPENPKESRQAAASFSNLTLDPEGDSRPASVCEVPAKEVPPTTPVRPSNSPIGGMRLESAKPVQFELARQRHKSPLRTKSSAVLEDIKQRCSGLFGRSGDERKSPASLAPVRPPRQRSKSTSHGPESAGIDSDEIIEVQPATPPSTLEREEPASGGKLIALASQLRHSAADFFHVEPKRNSPNKQERAISPKLPEEEALCEWKPVINSSKKMGKEVDERNATQSTQQHSLDTDSTWESSGEEEDVRLNERVDSSAVETVKSGKAESVHLDLEAEKLFESRNVEPPLVVPVGGGDIGKQEAKTNTFNHSDLQTFGSNKCFLNIEPNNNDDDDQREAVMDAIPLEALIPENLDANRATLLDVDSHHKLHVGPGEQLEIEQRVCKTPFKFSADLPPPTKQLVGGQIDVSQEIKNSKQSIEEKLEEKTELFSRSDQLIKEKPMAATCAVRALEENRFMKERGEESHEQVADDQPAENRLSVYENVEPAKKPAIRHWRRPVWPPASPQVDEPAAAEWAVEESGEPIAVRTRLEPERVGSEEKVVPAKPKRRLVTMTSIIQDPNDELMIPVKQDMKDNKPLIERRDSTFSTFATTDNNIDSEDDDDSSYAAAALSRQRIVSKFEPNLVRNKQAQTRPKFPAFADGKGAWPSGNGGGSVRRLAKNFDLTVQAQTSEKARSSPRPPLAAKPAALGRRLNSPAPESAGSVDEEPASESLWYDANSAEILDESEVAEFLRQFDNTEPKQVCKRDANDLSETAGESVSTGLDPFITLADSTIEDNNGLRIDEKQLEVSGDDDTLNDEFNDDDEDIINMANGECNEALERNQSAIALEVEQGKQAKSVVRLPRSSDSPNPSSELADPNDKSCAEMREESTCLKSEARGSSDIKQLESSNYRPSIEQDFVHEQTNLLVDDQLNSKTAANLPPKPTAQLIDDNFKNSLNHIIARRSSAQTALTSKASDMASKAPTSGCKELKGLTRYYHALLRRGRRHCRRKASDSGALKKPIMTDYIHSSSSSSSGSTASSISGSICSSPSISDDEEEDQVESSRHLVRAAKKCSRLYEELERILANRAEKERNSSISNKDNEFVDEFEDTLSTTTTERDDQISLSSSSVSSESIPVEMRQRQNLQKLYHVVNEIYSSEAKFVDTLRLLNEDFRKHVLTSGSNKCPSSQLPVDCVNNMLKQLPQLQALNENLLSELKLARDQWPKTQKIAHVLVKIGPFLKHYSTYIREFESSQQQFNENMKRYPLFIERVRQFEATDRCQKLTIQHHLLKPIQRIPQYRLLLQQYLHYLKPDDVDYEDTVNALEVVSRVAEHANQAMSEGANFAKLLALQAKIVGKQKDIVQPGRLFVKEGELMKVCRKQIQPRWFILLNDALLYLTQIQSSDILYLNNELPLDDCLISTPSESKQANLIGQQFETEFSVCTRTRSFALIAKSREERDDWVNTFRRTIDEHLARRRSFEIRRQSSQSSPAVIGSSNCLNQDSIDDSTSAVLLGQKAPLWTPDSRVTMCQLCTSSFSALFRRHHCRACGRVVCSACSSNKAPLIYLKCRAARVCDQCFDLLKANIHLYLPNGAQKETRGSKETEEMRKLDEHFHTLLRSQFVRHTGLRLTRHAHSGKSRKAAALSGHSERNSAHDSKKVSRVLKEVGANDSGSIISGYLHKRHQSKAKWKRQWFVIKDKVLYAYRAIDDVAAISSLPLLGYSIAQPTEPIDGLEPKSLLKLSHTSDYQQQRKLVPEEPENKRKLSSGSKESPALEHLFKAESVGAAERWLEALKKSVVLEETP